MVLIVNVVGSAWLFILDSKLEILHTIKGISSVKNFDLKTLWSQYLPTEVISPQAVHSKTINCMCSGCVIPLIVMNGVSHVLCLRLHDRLQMQSQRSHHPDYSTCFCTTAKTE